MLDLMECGTDFDAAMTWPIRAVTQRLTTTDRLLAAVNRRPRLRWRRALLATLREVDDGCHSILELRYARGVERAHSLPRGRRQRGRDRWRDDIAYEDYGVQVEIDGRLAHPDERAFRDRHRDNAAVLAGSRVLRYGYTDVTSHPCSVARQVAEVLRSAGWPGTARACAKGCTA